MTKSHVARVVFYSDSAHGRRPNGLLRILIEDSGMCIVT